MKQYHALGLMSGSSLDGLDIAYCVLDWEGERVGRWSIEAAETIAYDPVWRSRLANLPQQSAEVFAKTDVYFGYWMAEAVRRFRAERHIQRVDFIASHGHTVFHQPERNFTTQIGSGAALAARTNCLVINDFRSEDVAKGGQGAPLAPLVDRYLFSGYDYCANVGGILNISHRAPENPDAQIGFDVCYANQILNRLAEHLGLPYDDGGHVAAGGDLIRELLDELKALPFFHTRPPKSMANEWIAQVVWPLFARCEASVEDKLATATAHIAYEWAKATAKTWRNPASACRVLATGGGAYNTHLLELTRHTAQGEFGVHLDFELPSPKVIEFKEALLMALLGVLRLENRPNTTLPDLVAGALWGRIS